MLIEKCSISRYGKLADFDSGFQPGLNLVKGPNEAGKSTLVEAIVDALYENPKTRKKDVKERKSWGFERDFEIKLEFESEGKTYTLSKDFDDGSVSLTKKSSGEVLDDRKRVDSIVTGSLGLSNRDVFLATSCIRQDELSRIADSPDAIRDRLESLITGGREDTMASGAIDRIEGELKEISKQGYKTKGILQKLEDDRQDIIYETDKAKREIDNTSNNRARLKEVRTNLTSLKDESEIKTKQRDNARKAVECAEKLEDLEQRFGELQARVNNIKTSETTVKRLREKLQDLPKIDKTDVTLAAEQSAQTRYLESKRESAEVDVNELTETVDRAKPGAGIKLLFFLGILGSIGLAAYWYQFTAMTEIPFIVGAGVSAIVAIMFGILWSIKGRSLREVKARYLVKKTRLEEIEDDLKANEVAMEALLSKYKFTDINSLKDNYEDRYECEKDIKSEMNRYEGFLADKTLTELESELKEVTRDLAVEQERNRELKVYSIDTEELARLDSFSEAAVTGISKFEQEQISLEKQLDFAESGIEHLRSLQERLEFIEIRIERVKHRRDVIEKTRQFIEQARKDVLKSTLQLLEDETSGIMSEVTSGKYTKVKFDRQTLKYEVFSEEFSDWVNPGKSLSRGTSDQLYLAARLALVKIISEDKNPVIILDDPFVTFDTERRNNALRVLQSLSNDYQIIMLTCHDFYDEISANVISM